MEFIKCEWRWRSSQRFISARVVAVCASVFRFPRIGFHMDNKVIDHRCRGLKRCKWQLMLSFCVSDTIQGPASERLLTPCVDSCIRHYTCVIKMLPTHAYTASHGRWRRCQNDLAAKLIWNAKTSEFLFVGRNGFLWITAGAHTRPSCRSGDYITSQRAQPINTHRPKVRARRTPIFILLYHI